MIALPAVDLRRGRCVQLVGGDPDRERVALPDPLAVARRWRHLGFAGLHVVDLDAALGEGAHDDLVAKLLEVAPGETQVGGGVRDRARIEALLAAGAGRVLVGSRVVDDPEWFARAAEAYPARLVAALDHRRGRVLREGWTEESGSSLLPLVERVGRLPLAAILCTDVAREGRMRGTDLSTAREVVGASAIPVWIAGGIGSLGELRELREMGVAGAVLGMTLYGGRLDPKRVAGEFGARADG